MMKEKLLSVAKQLFYVLLLSIYVTGCATTVGPGVTDQEVSDKQTELTQKAVAYCNLQTKRIDAIGHRLISYMLPGDQEKVKNIRFSIQESADINAHATWGEVSVTYGMIRFTESDDEIAVVLGHELGHVLRGHVGKALVANTLSTVIGTAAAVALDTVTKGSGIGTSVGNVMGQGIAGSFSRDYEREADYYGLQYAYIAGFDVLRGSKVWERLSIEAPQTLTANLLSTHPSSPERLVRAEKALQELLASGIKPNVFQTPDSGVSASYTSPSILQKTMALPVKVLSLPMAMVGQPLSMLPSQGNSASNALPAQNNADQNQENLQDKKQALDEQKNELTKEELELRARQEELTLLLAEQNKRLQDVKNEAKQKAEEQVEFERVLLEAKEASKQNRYDEFGIERIGIAKKVMNLWVGQSIQGEQQVFPLSQGSIDWYAKYGEWSRNSWRSFLMIKRTYSAYLYSPDGKLFLHRDFKQVDGRVDFAKTTLQWDSALGDRMVGNWTLRVFESGKLVDERTFEIIK